VIQYTTPIFGGIVFDQDQHRLWLNGIEIATSSLTIAISWAIAEIFLQGGEQLDAS
jgi:hypothetical protein